MATTDRAAYPRCGAPRSADDPPGLCPREQGRDGPQPRPRVLRLMVVAAQIVVGGLSTTAYLVFDVERDREAIVSEVGDAGVDVNLGVALQAGGKLEQAVAEFREARDNAQRGFKLGPLIERALTATGHLSDRREPRTFRASAASFLTRPAWVRSWGRYARLSRLGYGPKICL
jgi:hypothetical protein